jgi:BlaI family penicillinase repressor
MPKVCTLDTAEAQRKTPRRILAQERRPRLTKLEHNVMEVFWAVGKASVREVLEAFPKPSPAYTTIQTIVYRLEMKKAVRRSRKIGNAHIFEPVISCDLPQADTRPKALDVLLNLVHGAMTRAVEYGELTIDDVHAVQEILRGHVRRRRRKSARPLAAVLPRKSGIGRRA